MAAILESGDIFFFYLPRAGLRQVRGLHDVARTYVLLSAQPTHPSRTRHQEKQHHRLFSIHGLRLPQPHGERGVWALLEQVAHNAQDLEHRLDPQGDGKAVVEKDLPLVRPAGEGRYALVEHGPHQHLAYVLELPDGLGDVQGALNIARQATYLVQIKAPDVASPIPSAAPPGYPNRLREALEPWELAPLFDLALLQYPGTQIFLLPTNQDVVGGIGLRPEREFNTTAETFRRLRLEPRLHPTDPLFTGDWA